MQLAHEMKPSDTVETSVTNGAADDAIDNTKDDDKDDENAAAAASEDSPSAAADEDSADVIDEAVLSAAAAASSQQRLSSDMIQQLAASLDGDQWLKLATQLDFQQDDISYIQTEHSTSTARASNMLTLWAVSISFRPE